MQKDKRKNKTQRFSDVEILQERIMKEVPKSG